MAGRPFGSGATAVAYLTSDAAIYLCGSALCVDDGWTAADRPDVVGQRRSRNGSLALRGKPPDRHGDVSADDPSDEAAFRLESDQVAGSTAPLMISRSAVSVLPLVSGPRSTAITTMTRKSIVLIIIGMAKPIFICTAI